MRRSFLFSILVLASVLAAGQGAVAKAIREIKRPTFSQPAFVPPGGEIEIRLEVPGEGKAESVKLRRTDGGEVSAAVLINSELGAGMNELNLTLPAETEAGLYDLCVRFAAGGELKEDCQPHSVAVVESFDPPFTFAQVSDYHLGDPRAERQFPGIDIEKVRLAALEAVNRAKPAFVLFTGDTAAYPRTYETDYPAAVDEILHNLRVPALFVSGNHDLYAWRENADEMMVEGMDYWTEYFGPLHRVLDFGPVRFILFDTYGWDAETRNQNRAYHSEAGTTHTFQGALTKEEYDRVKRALKTAGGRMPILVAHHGPRQFEPVPYQWCRDCVTPAKFLSLIKKAKAPYYIYGHIHRNTDQVEGPTRFISTTSVGSDCDPEELWGIRIFKVKGDLSIETEVIRLFDEVPMK